MKQKLYHDRGARPRWFSEGDKVWVQKVNSKGYEAGEIIKRQTDHSYLVMIQGTLRRKHADQLRLRSDTGISNEDNNETLEYEGQSKAVYLADEQFQPQIIGNKELQAAHSPELMKPAITPLVTGTMPTSGPEVGPCLIDPNHQPKVAGPNESVEVIQAERSHNRSMGDEDLQRNGGKSGKVCKEAVRIGIYKHRSLQQTVRLGTLLNPDLPECGNDLCGHMISIWNTLQQNKKEKGGRNVGFINTDINIMHCIWVCVIWNIDSLL